MALVSRSITPVSAIRRTANRLARVEETLSKIWGMKMMRRRRPTVKELGFSLVIQGALTYKLPLVGLCKLMVQLNHGPPIFRQKEPEKKDLINSTKKSCTKEIFESITGCKHPLIASGATTIGSSSRTPNKINTKNNKARKTR
jgi:hypothetical protein